MEGVEDVRMPPSVDRSLTLSMLDGGAGVYVCLYACVRSCVRGRSYAAVGGGYYNTATGRCVPPPRRIVFTLFCASVHVEPHAVAATRVFARGCAIGDVGSRPWAAATIMWRVP